MQEVFYPTQTLRATSEQPPDETADSGALFAEPFYVVFSTFKMFRYYFGPKLRVAPIDYEYFIGFVPEHLAHFIDSTFFVREYSVLRLPSVKEQILVLKYVKSILRHLRRAVLVAICARPPEEIFIYRQACYWFALVRKQCGIARLGG